MKAKVKATGQIIEVQPYAKKVYLEIIGDMGGKLYRDEELEEAYLPLCVRFKRKFGKRK